MVRSPSEIRGLTVAGTAVSVNQNVSIRTGADLPVIFDVYSAGRPVAGGRATVVYDGAAHDVVLNAAGRGSLILRRPAEGAHRLVIRYLGDLHREGAGAPVTVRVADPAAAVPTTRASAGSGGTNLCPTTARACVDLSGNTSWLQSGGRITYGPVPITSGRPGYRTPPGMFRVYWKDKDHRSSLFDGAPMPNSVFFVGGIAFHQGSLSVPSHGCIHLSWEASEVYWESLRNGDAVYVFGSAHY